MIRRAAAAALLLVLATVGAAQAAPGDLVAFSGTHGCIGDGADDCRSGRGLDGAESLVVSPDGRNVYVASGGANALATLDRDAASGLLTQPAGRAGCLAEGGDKRCARALGLSGAYAVAISPDGANVYTAAFRANAVAAFARDGGTGALHQLPGRAGCVKEFELEEPTGCTEGRGLASATAVAVSPDGRNVYVAADRSDAVAVFARDPATGALSQLPGLDGCVSDTGTGGACTAGDGLDGAEGIAISPDGRFVYVTAFTEGAIAVFARDAATGALHQLDGADGCLTTASKRPRCGFAFGLHGAYGVRLSPDGSTAYVASNGSSTIAVLTRDAASGRLVPLAGAMGCVRTGRYVFGSCLAARRLGGVASVAISATGDRLYGASFGDDGVVSFARDTTTGAIGQLPGRAGCTTHEARRGCGRVRGLDGASTIALSPDGHDVYVASDVSDTVTAFRVDGAG